MAIYYVRTCGNDNNEGFTPETALRTVGKALNKIIGPASSPALGTIYVGPGSGYLPWTTLAGSYGPGGLVGYLYPGSYISIIGDPSGLITGDEPGFVNAENNFWRWIVQSGNANSAVGVGVTTDYRTLEVRNIINVTLRCNTISDDEYWVSAKALIVGSPPAPVKPCDLDPDSFAVRMYVYNCTGTIGQPASSYNCPGKLKAVNCCGYFYANRNLAVTDYGNWTGLVEATNCIGEFRANSDNFATMDHCCIEVNAYPYFVDLGGNITDDPGYVVGNPYYYLQASSPCRDAGTTVDNRPTDMMGVNAPQGLQNDMGVHEYVDARYLNSLLITYPRYRGFEMIDRVEGILPEFDPTEEVYPKIRLYVQIATSPDFLPANLLYSSNSTDTAADYEYQDNAGVWQPYPVTGAEYEAYGNAWRCNVHNIVEPKGWLLYIRAWVRLL